MNTELKSNKHLLKHIKSTNHDFHSLVNILPYSGFNGVKQHQICYISIECYDKFDAPRFSYKTVYMDLKSIIRDCLIESFLEYDEPVKSDFDVESMIYTPEQLERLDKLRKEAKIKSDEVELRAYGFSELTKTKVEYSKNFEIGEKVYYNNAKGFITFKHDEKSEKTEQRWSVKVNDTEYRYINGTSIRKRKEEDLSHIPIDKELNKLSTEKLLKVFRKNRVRGEGDIRIKRILQDREHVQKGETKIVNPC